MNVYLTIYCRRLRPDIQIISRATEERAVTTLQRAGADAVVSYATVGATMVMNRLRRGNIVMLSEGMDLFQVPTPESLVGKRLDESGIRRETGCSVVAVHMGEDAELNPPGSYVLPDDSELILIGSAEGEEIFLDQFNSD